MIEPARVHDQCLSGDAVCPAELDHLSRDVVLVCRPFEKAAGRHALAVGRIQVSCRACPLEVPRRNAVTSISGASPPEYPEGGGYGRGYKNPTANGGDGGSGVVILKIPTVSYSGVSTGSPTVSTDGSDTILVFNSTGSYHG